MMEVAVCFSVSKKITELVHVMDSKDTNNRSNADKRKDMMQLRRRDMQNQLSTHRREALLLSRRMRRQELLNPRTLPNRTINSPEQSTSSSYVAGFPNQTALIIREPPPQSKTGCTLTSQANLGKGKAICDSSFIPEIGNLKASSEFNVAKIATELVHYRSIIIRVGS